MGSPWQDKETLQRLYVEKGLSAADIGEKLGCADTTVLDWLSRHDISTRDPDPPTMTGEDHPRSVSAEELVEDYKKVASQLKKTPSQQEYNDHGEYSWMAIRTRFGSMNDLQEAAGLEPLKNGKVSIECEVCSDSFEVKHARKDYRRFCSRSCMGEWMSISYRGENNPYDYRQVEYECEECGVVNKTNEAEAEARRFCSQDCMLEWRSRAFSGEGHPRYSGGKRSYRGPNWQTQRQKVLERDDYQCQLCGDDAESLNIHHIIPFHDFDSYEEANRTENLVALCNSCHSHVEWGNTSVQSQLALFNE